VTETLTFICSICGEPSTRICTYCTKDSCENHLCTRCTRCSDCCECDLHSWRGRTTGNHITPQTEPPNGATTTAAPSGDAGVEGRPKDQGNEVPGDEEGEGDVRLPE
jgi:hypothetical protein